MKDQCSINIGKQKRYIPIAEFCKQYGMTLDSARWQVREGKLKIKPKKKSHERVYIDLEHFHKEWYV